MVREAIHGALLSKTRDEAKPERAMFNDVNSNNTMMATWTPAPGPSL